MLPYSSTTNVLDSPVKKIKSLIDAAKVQLDPKVTLRQYVRSAIAILNLADTARVKGDMEGAFVNYLKGTTIVLEIVPQVKDFEKQKNDSEYLGIKKRVVGLFSDTEKIKELLQAKYESIQDIEALALAAAAKAGKPKPPPRPNKPKFLSASQHDGLAPITAASAFANSSSSAPPTPLPTMYGSSSQPSSEPFRPQPTSIPMNPNQGTTALPSTTPLVPFSAGPIPFNHPSGSVPFFQATSPVPVPRTVLTPAPPASAPAAMPSGGVDSKPPPQTSTQSNASATPTVANTNGEYQFSLSIKPQRLLDYFRQPNPPSLLLIDVRMQVQYKSAKIKAKSMVNVEPLALRDGVSAKTIAEQGLFNNPLEERKLFADRASFDLVIYYDQNSQEKEHSPPLITLFRALHDLEFDTVLSRRPVLLIGGFDAWLDCAGMDWVEGQDVDNAKSLHPSPTPSLDHMGQNGSYRSGSSSMATSPNQTYSILTKVARGGGISRTEGKAILANIEDYIHREDSPQSMINPRNVSAPLKVPNQAYPPQATPYSNINASFPPNQLGYNSPSSANNGSNNPTFAGSYPPMHPGAASIAGRLGDPNIWMQPGNQSIGSVVPSNGMGTRRDAVPGQLSRRMTVYDNHWNEFGSEKPFSHTAILPPIPDKIPLVGSNISAGIAGSNTMYGPNMPAPAPNMTSRPPIPSKPMRPLPQPPGMNDLKDYTKFGSGFSKIGGSQLGKAGLTNLGNTCYMNSVIQCLIATPPLTRFFMDGSFKRYINIANPLGTQGRLADAFCTLIRSMWSGQSLVSPTGFRNEISGFAPQFKGNEQHDSQEFLSFLLDGLHEDLKLMPRLLPPGVDDEGSEADEARMEVMPEIEATGIAWQRYLRRDSSIIVNIFQGQYKSRLCCSKCGKTSTTYNPFMYLTLPVKAKNSSRQPQTLTSCLNAFVEPELMEGDNAWNCPNCKKPRKATKQLTISRVPDVLLIQLKRFSSEGPFKNKIKAMVQYPIENLDLTKYLPKRTANQGPVEPAIYNLYAVSNHSGEVSSGHYTACVRDTTFNGWTNFDDTRVSPCDKSVAVSEHGYTLFYVRRKHGDH
ncbi:ubiquitin-specific protease doa4 [Linnemannia gamsii]|uniref:ubiquitinyl hydrolase 1 n=1 Tax=Linnemannia gamsii TaxID=64522 RepID=A0ABQ7JT78_9FUNG|nr:ubiquitin-specific protease doa4 [Linnemannia gamsii]